MIEVPTAHPVDASETDGIIVRIVFKSGFHLMRHGTAVSAVGIAPFAYYDAFYIRKSFPDVCRRERTQYIRADYACLDAL